MRRASRGARRVYPPFLCGAVLCAAVLWAGLPPPAYGGDFRGYPGRRLVEALDDLRAQGLAIIYSSDLVRPDMVITAEPDAGSPRRLLDQLLAPFGLEGQDGPAGTVLIVRSAAASRDDPDGGARPPLPATLREKIEVRSSIPEALAGQPEARQGLGQEEIRQTPQIGEDPGRIIARLPGIAAGDKSAAFRIRGGEVDDTLFVLDGLVIDDPIHLKDLLGFSSIIDSNALDGIEVLSGGFPAEYGGRMGGVVDLSSRRPAGAPSSSFVASSVNSSYMTNGGFAGRDGGWLLSTRAWRPDAVVDMVDPGGEGLNPSYYDLLGKVETTLANGTVLSGHVLASRDDVDAEAAPDHGRVHATGDSQYAWLTLKTPWTGRLVSTTLLSLGSVRRGRGGGFVGDTGSAAGVDDAESFTSDSVRQDWMFEGSDRAALGWGFGAKRVDAEYDDTIHAQTVDPLFTGGLPVVTDRAVRLRTAGTDLGAYLSGRLRPLSPLTLELGARWDRQTLTQESEVSPRVNVLYAIGPRSALRLGWGHFYQPQGPQEIRVEDGERDPFPAERSEIRSINLDHVFDGGWSLGVGAYDKEMSRLRPRYENLFDPVVIYPELEPDRVRVAPQRSGARGVELTLSRDNGRAWGWWVGYALARAEDVIDGLTVPRSQDQRHTLNFVVRYRRASRWEFTLAGQYHTGWPTTDVTAVATQNPDGTTAIQPILGTRNAMRFPAYHRLDLAVRRRLDLSRGTLAVFLEITNLYGHDNVCCVKEFSYLPQPDGTVAVARHDGYWLRQLPVFGLTWEFGR